LLSCVLGFLQIWWVLLLSLQKKICGRPPLEWPPLDEWIVPSCGPCLDRLLPCLHRQFGMQPRHLRHPRTAVWVRRVRLFDSPKPCIFRSHGARTAGSSSLLS
jgi:hypothetical protein